MFQAAILEGKKYEVTALASSPDCRTRDQTMAVGYSDGTVRLFDLSSGEERATFSGHTKAVSALNFDSIGMRLVSGALVSAASEKKGMMNTRYKQVDKTVGGVHSQQL